MYMMCLTMSRSSRAHQDAFRGVLGRSSISTGQGPLARRRGTVMAKQGLAHEVLMDGMARTMPEIPLAGVWIAITRSGLAAYHFHASAVPENMPKSTLFYSSCTCFPIVCTILPQQCSRRAVPAALGHPPISKSAVSGSASQPDREGPHGLPGHADPCIPLGTAWLVTEIPLLPTTIPPPVHN